MYHLQMFSDFMSKRLFALPCQDLDGIFHSAFQEGSFHLTLRWPWGWPSWMDTEEIQVADELLGMAQSLWWEWWPGKPPVSCGGYGLEGGFCCSHLVSLGNQTFLPLSLFWTLWVWSGSEGFPDSLPHPSFGGKDSPFWGWARAEIGVSCGGKGRVLGITVAVDCPCWWEMSFWKMHEKCLFHCQILQEKIICINKRLAVSFVQLEH